MITSLVDSVWHCDHIPLVDSVWHCDHITLVDPVWHCDHITLVDSVWHCDHITGEEEAGCFAFLWFVACVLSVLVCLLLFLMSLVGCVL